MGGEGGGDLPSLVNMEHANLVDDGDHDVEQKWEEKEQQKPELSRAPGSSSSADASKMIVEKTESSGGRAAPVEEYEVVYVKDNVSAQPTQTANGRISGRLRLIKLGDVLFMETWIPHAQGGVPKEASNASGGDRNRNSLNKATDRDLYAIRTFSMEEVRSIRRHTPPIGWHYIIVVLQSGLALPPLYFHNGGVRDFLNALKAHGTVLRRSAEDANVYLVNDVEDPLQKSLTSLDLSVAGSPALTLEAFPTSPTASTTSSQNLDESTRDVSGKELVTAGRPITPPSKRKQKDPARDISLQVLEKFSLVTKFARDTSAQLFGGENRMLGSFPIDGFEDHGPGPRRQDSAAVPALPAPGKQSRDSMSSSSQDLEAFTSVGTFELVDGKETDPPLVWGKARPAPLTNDEWNTFMDDEGRIINAPALQKRVFHGGLQPGLRSFVWKFLLGYFPFESTYAEREFLMVQKREEYDTLKNQWKSVSEEQAKRFAKYRERKHRVEKDVVRTDRVLPFYEGDDNVNVTTLRDILVTYAFYNFDLGYCQGMSDLLSPILFVVQDEAEAFWCFASLMERMAPNFNRDQNGMHAQLLALSKLVQLLDGPLHDYFEKNQCLNYFFCFRWVLIQFKREFEYEDVLRLWEVLWSRHLSEHFHLYMCAALLKRHRRKIMDEEMEFDTLLKFINELSGHISLDATLRDAEALCLFAGDRGVACIPPGTPPAFPVTEPLSE